MPPLNAASRRRREVAGRRSSWTLFVIAKRQELKLGDVEITLQCLPCDTQGYEKSAPPHIPRVAEPLTCYRCGATGHIARECADWCDVA